MFLEGWLDSLPEGKKIVFIDELPWMDTMRSNFIRALNHFWKSWATARKDIVLVVCSSATSWIIDNIVMNYGGLHNRITKKIHLRPFTLHECEVHIKVINALSAKKAGMRRSEILENAKLSDNEQFCKVLKELEQCGFLRKYTCLGKSVKDSLYQLMDNYTLFYFQFILHNKNGDKCFWTSMYNSPLHNNWAGLAFERVCLEHLEQIKKALGFSAVISTAYFWTTHGAQIDLLIDRNDGIINV